MRPFLVIDSETDPFKQGRIPEPFVWGVYDGKIFSHYHNDNFHSLLKWISKQRVIVYAHNGVKFDYHFMLSYLEPYDNIKIINGRIAQFWIGKAEFRDSFNILPERLEMMEIDVNGEKIGKQDFDYAILERDVRYKAENWEKTISYLRDDCRTLYHMIAAFQEKYGRHLTMAGAAMARWKKISQKEIPHSTQEFFEQFKKYYYGGRVQCFKHGIVEKDFSVYDINSAYPFAMLREHAYGLSFVESDRELAECDRETAFFEIYAKSIGALPFREKTGLSFPADREYRCFSVTGWELQSAIDTLPRVFEFSVQKVYYPNETTNFREYIEYFYHERLRAKATGDKANDLFAKRLMNSLYGKFGSNPNNYSNFIILPDDERANLESEYNGGYHDCGELGPWILAEKDLEDEEKRFFNVATAASITGFVRAYLWRAICACGVDSILYCDTDSLATHSDGNALDTGPGLGQWKHEGEFDRAGIAGKKLYIFRGKKKGNKEREYKTASKGVKLSRAQLWKVASGSVVNYESENPTFSVHSKPRFVSRRIVLTK
jgi:hypothetical protein